MGRILVGPGYLILTFNNQTATPEVFAAVAALSAIGVALFGIVSLLERLLLPWYHQPRGGLHWRSERALGG